MNHVNDKRKKRETLRDFNQRDRDEGRERKRKAKRKDERICARVR
jgi:hypothetical protein